MPAMKVKLTLAKPVPDKNNTMSHVIETEVSNHEQVENATGFWISTQTRSKGRFIPMSNVVHIDTD